MIRTYTSEPSRARAPRPQRIAGAQPLQELGIELKDLSNWLGGCTRRGGRRRRSRKNVFRRLSAPGAAPGNPHFHDRRTAIVPDRDMAPRSHLHNSKQN